MYLYLVSCDCAGLCIKCSVCPCQCFLVKIAFYQGFRPSKCMRHRYLQFTVFYVIFRYSYIGIYSLHRYLHENSLLHSPTGHRSLFSVGISAA